MTDAEIKHTLFRRKNGRWCITVVPLGAAWKDAVQIQAPAEVTGGSSDRPSPAAKKWRDDMLDAIRANGGRPPAKKQSSPTIRECHKKLMTVREGQPRLKSSTVKNNWTHLNAQILNREVNTDPAASISDVPMGSVSIPRAAAYLRAVRGRVSANHCRNIYSTVCVLYDVAEALGLIPQGFKPFSNTLVVAELPAQRNQKGDGINPITIPLAAFQALLDAPDELVALERKVRDACGVLGGFDDGEIAGFTWAHALGLPDDAAKRPKPRNQLELLEPIVPYLEVRQAISIRGKDGFATLDTPKTVNRLRDVPMHPALTALIVAWRARWEQLMCRKPTPKDFLFPTLEGKGSRPPSAQRLRDDLRVVNALAIGRGELPYVTEEQLALIDFKATRRTFSSALKARGIDGETRGKLMGHRAKTVTTRNYTAHELVELAEAIARIPVRWGSVAIAVTTELEPSQNVPVRAEKPSSSPTVPLRRGWDSNPRMTVLQSDRACEGTSIDEPPSAGNSCVTSSSTDGMRGRDGADAAFPAVAVTGVSVAAGDAASPRERPLDEARVRVGLGLPGPSKVVERDIKPDNVRKRRHGGAS